MTKQEKKAKSTKSVTSTEPSALISNTLLNNYVLDYMKDLPEETYELLEEKGRYESAPPTAPKAPAYKHRNNLLTLVTSALVDTAVPVVPVEDKKKRITTKHEGNTYVNSRLEEILGGLLASTAPEEPGEVANDELKMYEGLLTRVIATNNTNKQRLLDGRRTQMAQLYKLSLINTIDQEIESVYNRKYKVKKKKKEEDTSYFQELEDLLEKRNKIKGICSGLSDDLLEIGLPDTGIECVMEQFEGGEYEMLKNMLPEAYFRVLDKGG
ncbi:hypothetical protein NEDG_01332 [Nematocida displodere]|uniref:Uncharacterized protein n=1 Tax=Nematocida displodere TaxID=1805483 RepID=A0A177EE32_9MICR|nr:hypothetical protein NEDG_01332 [Nematocida displodere]